MKKDNKPIDLRPYTKIVPVPYLDITKEQFLVYEQVRMSGKVNMLDFPKSCKATGLKPEELKSIIQNYNNLFYKFSQYAAK